MIALEWVIMRGGYKTGKLYLIVKFNDKFQADKDIVYEVY